MHVNARLSGQLAAAPAGVARSLHTAPGVVVVPAAAAAAAGPAGSVGGGGVFLEAVPRGCRRGYSWSAARLREVDSSGSGKEPAGTGAGAGAGTAGASTVGADAGGDSGKNEAGRKERDGDGAMSRRLEQMTDEMVEGSGGKRARKAVQEAGFSEDLKRRLEERIAEGRSGGAGLGSAASSVLTMPASAGAGTRDAAMARPWTGNESVEDASLRMLTDAHKPLRGGAAGGAGRSARAAAPKRSPTTGGIDARMKAAASKATSGHRLLNARDKTSLYAVSQDPTLSEQEKEDMRKLLRERFQPGARPMPTSIQGLASLANERIEDAIARGQFKNIARGKGVNQQVDYNANSPFLNTTEYFMNKMIQRQDIVPPWIEKQQEVIKTAATFRSRLRNDWRRHAARVIASKGGPLGEQIRRAEAYAAAEARMNPRPQKVEAVSRIDASGRLTGQVNVVETPVVGGSSSLSSLPSSSDDGSSKITVAETKPGTAAAAEVASEAVADTRTESSQAGSSSQFEEQLLQVNESPSSSQQQQQQQQQQEILASSTTASTSPPSSQSNSSSATATTTTTAASTYTTASTSPSTPPPTTTTTKTTTTATPSTTSTTSSHPHPQPNPHPHQPPPLNLPPFRDPAWESLELAYHTAALKELNNLTRSYNLMAPELAKRPYYSLPRELTSCFADVAPQLAEALRERARRPPPDRSLADAVGHRSGGVLERFGGESARVYDSKRPHYGFREFWRQLWRKEERESVRR